MEFLRNFYQVFPEYKHVDVSWHMKRVFSLILINSAKDLPGR